MRSVLTRFITFFRRFFLKSALPIADELRREVGRIVKSSPSLEPPVGLFDEAQAQVESLISNTTYPNFLKSDMYLHYIQVIRFRAIGGNLVHKFTSAFSLCRIQAVAARTSVASPALPVAPLAPKNCPTSPAESALFQSSTKTWSCLRNR